MPRIKCPYCKRNGAFLYPEILRISRYVAKAISCKNPSCRCYDPSIEKRNIFCAESSLYASKIFSYIRKYKLINWTSILELKRKKVDKKGTKNFIKILIQWLVVVAILNFYGCQYFSKNAGQFPNSANTAAYLPSKYHSFFGELQSGWKNVKWGTGLNDFKNQFPQNRHFDGDLVATDGGGPVALWNHRWHTFYSFNSDLKFYQIVLVPDSPKKQFDFDKIRKELNLSPTPHWYWHL